MKKILIADPNKASLVMTSEMFKDNYPGIHIYIASTAQEVEILAKDQKDIEFFVIDVELSDAQGVQTALKLKKAMKKPVLITGLDLTNATASQTQHFAKEKNQEHWMKKPIAAQALVELVNKLVYKQKRNHKRVECQIPAMVKIGKKWQMGMIEDCSLGGIKFRLLDKISKKTPSLKVGQELEVKTLDFQKIKYGEMGKYPMRPDECTSVFSGQIRWQNTNQVGEMAMGLECKQLVVMKELFESVTFSLSKQSKNCLFYTALTPGKR